MRTVEQRKCGCGRNCVRAHGERVLLVEWREALGSALRVALATDGEAECELLARTPIPYRPGAWRALVEQGPVSRTQWLSLSARDLALWWHDSLAGVIKARESLSSCLGLRSRVAWEREMSRSLASAVVAARLLEPGDPLRMATASLDEGIDDDLAQRVVPDMLAVLREVWRSEATLAASFGALTLRAEACAPCALTWSRYGSGANDGPDVRWSCH